MTKRAAPRPDHVVIGHMTFGIEYVEEQDWAIQFRGHDGESGLTFAHSCMIVVRCTPDINEQNVREILLHEITHACWAASGLTYRTDEVPKDVEEWAITYQTPVFLFVLQQNEHVVKYLTDGVE